MESVAPTPRRVVAILVTVAMSLHVFSGFAWYCVGPLLDTLTAPWPYRLTILIMAAMLTVWSPVAFGLTWGDTWKARRIVITVSGVMTAIACAAMLFIRVPFYGGSNTIFLTVPLTEELIFRGFLFAVIEDAFPRRWKIGRYSVAPAVIFTAIAFGFWHLGGLRWPTDGFIWFQVFYTTIAGLGFGVMRQATGSLWAPWLVHLVINVWAATVPSIFAST